jgi:phage shock protein E
MCTALVLIFIFVSCDKKPHKYENQDIKSANQTIQEKKDLQILDVRTPQEYEEGHIKNAINKNWYDSNFSSKLESLNTSKPVLIYCKAGGRSTRASEKLTKMGFKEVINLEGGVDAWSAAGLPIVK